MGHCHLVDIVYKPAYNLHILSVKVLVTVVSNNQHLRVISFSDCAVTMTQSFGVITSPGFPQLYKNWIGCTWNIQLSIGQLIRFNFLHFDLQYGDRCWWDTFLTFFQNDQWLILYHHIKNFLGLIHWQFMMVVQIHHPCWEIHIVVIPCHQAKSLQATTSSFIFILILLSLEMDSNWNTMQQVRIHMPNPSAGSKTIASK